MLGHRVGEKVYHLWSLASVNVRASCSGKMSPKPLWQQTGRGNQNGFRGGLCVVWGMGRNVLPAAPEAVAGAVHLQDVDVVGETVQQRAGHGFCAGDLPSPLTAAFEMRPVQPSCF